MSYTKQQKRVLNALYPDKHLTNEELNDAIGVTFNHSAVFSLNPSGLIAFNNGIYPEPKRLYLTEQGRATVEELRSRNLATWVNWILTIIAIVISLIALLKQ